MNKNGLWNCSELHRYTTNRENAERQCSTKDDSKHAIGKMWPTSHVSETKSTTEALSVVIAMVNTGVLNVKRTLPWQPGKIKIKGHCFVCLKPGHHQKDCKSNKVCVCCKQRNRHHWSLCINKFPVEKPRATVNSVTAPLSTTIATENTLLSSDEQVLMQTATAEVEDLQKSRRDYQIAPGHS